MSHDNLVSSRKSYPECLNFNETLHVPRLSISPAAYSRLMGNEFRDFEKFKKNIFKFLLKSGCGPRRFSRGGVLLSELEASPLQVI